MKKIIFVFLLLLSTKLFAGGPCLTAANGQYPAGNYTPACIGLNEQITTCGFGSEYSVVNVVNGTTYTFSSSFVTDIITISNAAGTVTYTFGTGTVVWTATFTGTIRFYTHITGCGSDISCRTKTVQCGTPPTCPSGLGTGVVNVASLPYVSGAGTTCGFVNDISSMAVPTCGSTLYFSQEDKVFRFIPTTSGNVNINLTSSGSYTGLTLFQGCPFSGVCVGSAQSSAGNQAMTACVTAGVTYYLILGGWSTPTCNPYSNLTISAPNSVITNNDFCLTPQPITSGIGNMAGNTTTYTVDSPGNVGSVFCGSIENNQWYSFVATSTSATFSFNGITCTNGWGIQAQVFSVTTSGLPCPTCNSFTSMGTCYNPATTTAGSTTATGLTIGQTYYLMIDGNGGDICNFTLNNWATTVLLPIKLISFSGERFGSFDKIKWVTDEYNQYFVLEHSLDGINFNEIYITDVNKSNYEFMYKTSEIKNYYRLKQVGYDGKINMSSIIVIDNSIDISLKIVKITNLLGQEVGGDYNGPIFIHYNDGSVVKKHKI